LDTPSLFQQRDVIGPPGVRNTLEENLKDVFVILVGI
jgi:hypothetical protein